MSGDHRGRRETQVGASEQFDPDDQEALLSPPSAAAAAAAAALAAMPCTAPAQAMVTRMASGRLGMHDELGSDSAMLLPNEELLGASAADNGADRALLDATTGAPPAAEWPGLRGNDASAERSGATIDKELLQYAHWISTKASMGDNVELKLAALSRRSAQELKRAERERGDLARRLEALESMCMGSEEAPGLLAVSSQRIEVVQGSLDELRQRVDATVGMSAAAREEPVERTVERLMFNNVQPVLGQMAADVAVAVEQQINGAIETLTKDVEELRKQLRSQPSNGADGQGPADNKLIAQIRAEWEPALSKERQAAQERLTANCSELTRYLNELREEVIEQRTSTDKASKEVQAARQELLRNIQARDSRLEAKLVDLGAQLAARMEDTVAAAARALREHFVPPQ